MSRTGLLLAATCICAIVGLSAHHTASGAPPPEPRLSPHPATIDAITYFDANSLLMFVSNFGSFAYDRTASLGKNDGLYFPNGDTKSVMYAAGIWVGALVNGQVRLALAEYSADFVPCPMINGLPRPDDDSCRVYRINQGDTRLTNPDYAGWPFDWGAPAVKDHAGSDSLDDQGLRIPLCKGAQALWTVFNDASPAGHASGGTLPLGIEVRLYVYGDDLSCHTSNSLIMEYTIINAGPNLLEDVHVALWADPDIGTAADDLVGCVPERSLGFAYNDSTDGFYGSFPPAVGFSLLQGPMIPSGGSAAWQTASGRWVIDHRNLPMTGFLKYINGTDPDNPIEVINYLRGRYPDGSDIIDPGTGLPTTFMVSGDPLSGTGWVDSAPSDRRYVVATGPFSMEQGDTQEIAIAVIAGAGTQ